MLNGKYWPNSRWGVENDSWTVKCNTNMGLSRVPPPVKHNKHGVRAIKKSRWAKNGKDYYPENLACPQVTDPQKAANGNYWGALYRQKEVFQQFGRCFNYDPCAAGYKFAYGDRCTPEK